MLPSKIISPLLFTIALFLAVIVTALLFNVFDSFSFNALNSTITQGQMVESNAEFEKGVLENLIIREGGERGGQTEMALKVSQIDFEKSIIADNFLSARSVHATDLDNDGDMDILGAARYIHEIAWWENKGNTAFVKHVIDNNFRGAFSVHSADLNQDGYQDIIGASLYDGIIAWWENQHNGTFINRKIIDNNFVGAIYTYSADIDEDGYADVLGAAESADQVAWWRNQGDGTFGKRIIIGDNFTGARSVHAVDVDNDGDVDVLGAARFIDEIAWWENKDGEGNEFVKRIVDNNFDGPRSVHATDIDGDGDMDILGAARYGHQIALWENNGNKIFNKIIIANNFRGATNVFTADIDRDGKEDIIAAAVFGDQVAWWKNEGNLRFTEFIIDYDFDAATFVYPADINKDGYLDILSAAVFDNQIALWTSRPQYLSPGVFTSAILEKKEKRLIDLNWVGVSLPHTFLRFQIRSGNSREELIASNWYGPTLQNNYYTVTGTKINAIHNEHQLMQYRVFFTTDDIISSPKLDKVFINYDSIFYPGANSGRD